MRLAIVLAALAAAVPAFAQTCSMHAPGTAPTAGTPMLLDGLGKHTHKVTASAEAQKWFDQGLNLVYAFNHDEAIRSFQQGAKLDPSCAMCWWGVALALGPNINMPLDSEREKLARAAVSKASALAPKASAAERDYIEALSFRYRHKGDKAYADAMKQVARRHHKDADALVLYSESLMDLRPWDLWTKDGKPQPGTKDALAALNLALKLDPDHPGANHYLIHVLEASPHPERALEAAKKLPTLMPGAGHIVHMPAHIYMRLGRYADATNANEQAIEVDKAYVAKVHPEGAYASMYVAHNFQFLVASASMEGRSEEALEAAKGMAAHLPPETIRAMAKEMPGVDFFLAPTVLVKVRFAKWDEIIAEPAPPADLPYLGALWHFARGMAYANKLQFEPANAERAQLDSFVDKIPADLMLGPTNSAKAIYGVAQAMLAGEIASRQRNHEEAIESLELAAQREDALHYDEPPPWWLPVREYLGAEYLAADKPELAAAAYRLDLAKNPENGWSLFGLIRATAGQKRVDAGELQHRFEVAWSRADVKLANSRL